MKISDNIIYIGVNDHKIDLFEGQYAVPNGMAYNSYLILDEKIAVMDTVDANFTDEWLGNLNNALNGRKPDYLVIQHMEPDHSANIMNFMKVYPETQIVASAKAFAMMKSFFGEDLSANGITVGDKDTLSLGETTLTFVTALMVHWPEVIMTYDSRDKVLFSADGFGKFGALDAEEEWACEARRYYFGIVGKYGVQVQNLLKKVSGLDIKIICPLHGPVLSNDLEYYLSLYNTWSKYEAESSGVMIAYTSVYGNTKNAVMELAGILREKGCEKVVISDLARSDMAECVEDAFRYDRIVFATTTYNGDMFPFMKDFINRLTEHSFQNRKVGFIENGTWAPMAAKSMKAILEKCKDLTFCENVVQINSSVDENSMKQISALADELC
ncbi:MAG: FprA family A-type flavoprotein [Oscillospiraceae bacterium]